MTISGVERVKGGRPLVNRFSAPGELENRALPDAEKAT